MRSRTQVSKRALQRLTTTALGGRLVRVAGGGLQRSVRDWALRQGWGDGPVRQEQAQGILVAALGMLAAHAGYGEARRAC